MVDAIRAAGGRQPVSTGDGAWGIEATGADTGFCLADTARLCDFLGPHVYPAEDDVTRTHYAAAWACELAGTYGRPVVLEEFGVSSAFVADANIARYYRQVLHNTLLAGATGWVAWNNTDFDLAGQDPYRHHGFELRFGLTDARGAPKAQLAQMRAFGRLLDQIGATRCARADCDTALVIPSYLDTVYPFTQERDRTSLAGTLRQAYIAARLADVPVALTRESQSLGHGGRLYLVPSTKHLLGPTWAELERFAEGGATVYVSYSRGSHAVHRGPWHTHLNAMFGVEHDLGYGSADTITDDEVTLTLATDFGTLGRGARLSFRPEGSAHARGYLPVRPAGAEVLAVDGHGRPALLRRQAGQGSVVLCTYPVEQMAALAARPVTEAISGLYDALASHAGVRRAVTVDDPHVATDVLVRDDGQRFAWLVSQAGEQVTAKPQLADGTRLRELDGSPVGDSVTIGPYGVAVYALDDAAATGPA
jgi:endo-1,4-beta-mannosidase